MEADIDLSGRCKRPVQRPLGATRCRGTGSRGHNRTDTRLPAPQDHRHAALPNQAGVLDSDTEVEWRDRIDNPASFGDSYLATYSRAKASVPFNGSLKAVGRLHLETVDFHSAGAFALDYIRGGGTLGLERTFADFSWAEFSLLYSQRTTSDSAELDYTAAGAEASFLGFLPTGSLDLLTRLESRNYRRSEDRDDHWRTEILGRNRVSLGDRWFGLQEVDLEKVWYSAEDWVNADYLRLGGNLQFGAEIDGLTVAVGPDLELLTRTGEIADSLAFDGEDYWEAGGKIDIDFLGDKGLFISTESTTGYRTLWYENELQASFLYERVYLFADIRILSALILSTMFSAEFEWYGNGSNNSQLYLLSTSLTYSL